MFSLRCLQGRFALRLMALYLSSTALITGIQAGGGPDPHDLQDERRFIHAQGSWHATDQGLLLKAKGDVVVAGGSLGKTICILTDGRVIFHQGVYFQGDGAIQAQGVLLQGDLNVRGALNIWADELRVQGSLTVGRGLSGELNTLLNHGLLSVGGSGLQGCITHITNAGKTELTGAQLKTQRFCNTNQGIVRTRGHFVLEGDFFQNHGTFFTTGVHQLTLQTAYEDAGHLYVPTLYLVRAPRVEFLSGHRAWLREALITGAL